jgi:hypothetical protein
VVAGTSAAVVTVDQPFWGKQGSLQERQGDRSGERGGIARRRAGRLLPSQAAKTAADRFVGRGGAMALVAVAAGLWVVAPNLAGHPDGDGRPHMEIPRPSRDEARSPYSTSVSASVRRGPLTIASTAYTSPDGSICASVDQIRNDVSIPNQFSSCLGPTQLTNRLTGSRVFALGWGTDSDMAILRGFTGEEVERITGEGPDGPLKVSLSEPWQPDAVDGEPTLPVRVRTFVAVETHRRDRRYQTGSELYAEINGYRITAYLSDGTVLHVDNLFVG